MYQINEKIRDLTPYEPISGNCRIRLDANESFLSLPESMKADISRKIMNIDLNRYPNALAAELCEAFAGYYGIDSKNVAAGNGSDELISVIFNGFLMKGDKYASLTKDFSMYDFYGSISEAVNIKIAKNEDFSIDVDTVIRECNREDVKLLVFSNPCNPTSLGLDRSKIRKILREVKCLVVLDEAYMEFWNQSMLGEINDFDNLLILKTCSKAFGMAGIRVGFAVGNKNLIGAIKAVKSPYNVNSISQCIAAQVLRCRKECREAVETILSAKEKLGKDLLSLEEKYPDKIKILPSNTNFFAMRTEHAKGIFSFLMDRGIVIRFFGDFLRITAGSPAENAELIKELKEYFESIG